MSLITVERIKLFSTRSPWWCMIVAAVLSIGLAALATGFASGPDELRVTPAMTQFGVGLGQMVIMVMAALAVTTEYRFGTIRTSFQAVPQRAALLLNKTIVVATLAAVVGLVASWGSWAIGSLLASGADMTIDTAAEWRLMFGQGLVYGFAAIFAVAVGILIRQSSRRDRDPDPVAAAGREPAAADPEDRRRPAEVDAVHQREPVPQRWSGHGPGRCRRHAAPAPRCHRGGRWRTSRPGASASW